MVSDLKTFAHKWCKIAAQKKEKKHGEVCLTSKIFLVSVLLSALVERYALSPICGIFNKKSIIYLPGKYKPIFYHQ